MELGLTLFNFSKYIKTYDDLDTVLDFLAQRDIFNVQVSGISHLDYVEIAKHCQKFNTNVCLTHNNTKRILGDTDKLIEEHKALNCKNIGIGAMEPEYYSLDGYKRFISDFSIAAKKIKEAGMQFNYHNHAFEFEKYYGRRGMDMLIEDSDSELFNFVIDIHWIQTGGCNPVDYIKKVAGRMSLCHFKDYKIINNERRFAEIGTGNLDLDACWKACEETGVKYIIIEQDQTDMDLFDSADLSIRNLKEIKRRNSL